MITYTIGICIHHNQNVHILIILYSYVQCHICVKGGLLYNGDPTQFYHIVTL